MVPGPFSNMTSVSFKGPQWIPPSVYACPWNSAPPNSTWPHTFLVWSITFCITFCPWKAEFTLVVYKSPVVLGITQFTSHQLENYTPEAKGVNLILSHRLIVLWKVAQLMWTENFQPNLAIHYCSQRLAREGTSVYSTVILWVSFISALITFMKTQFCDLIIFPAPNTITLGVRISIYKLGRRQCPVYHSHGHRRNTAVHLKSPAPSWENWVTAITTLCSFNQHLAPSSYV